MTLFDTPVDKNPVAEALVKKMISGVGEGWTEFFKGADNILHEIAGQLIKEKVTICPSAEEVFNAFRECRLSTLKVVFVLQDPYHQVINGLRVADGIAMSCSHTRNLQPSLRLVYDEIERTVGKTERNPDLRCWANQGVLMMNTALTVQQAKPGSHTEIWRPFTQYMLRELSRRYPKLIYVFCGSNAKSFSNFASSGTKYYTVHPAAAAYRGGLWDSENVFNNINYVLGNQGIGKIEW